MKTFALLTLLVIATPILASSTADRSINELYTESSTVLGVRIAGIASECSQEKSCSFYRSSARVESQFKGKSSGISEIEFCTLFPLEINVSYVIFLSANDENENNNTSCNFIAPQDGVFEKVLDDFFRLGSYEGTIFFKFEGRTFRSSAVEEQNFLQAIKNSSKDSIE